MPTVICASCARRSNYSNRRGVRIAALNCPFCGGTLRSPRAGSSALKDKLYRVCYLPVVRTAEGIFNLRYVLAPKSKARYFHDLEYVPQEIHYYIRQVRDAGLEPVLWVEQRNAQGVFERLSDADMVPLFQQASTLGVSNS